MKSIRKSMVAALFAAVIALSTVFVSSCQEEKEDNTGLLLMLWALNQGGDDSYLMTIPPGVAQD